MKQLLSLFDKYSFSPKVGKRLGESSSKILFMGLLLTALLCTTQSIYAQQDTAITVTGTVTDSQGVPLPGVNIKEQNTTNGTLTDFDGNYSFTATLDSGLGSLV